MEANTPCPFQGVIGPEARELWEKYPKLRPDYEEHLAKQKVVARIDEEIAEKERIEAERIAAEAAAITLHWFQSRDLKVDLKKDHTEVTDADKAVEEYLRK